MAGYFRAVLGALCLVVALALAPPPAAARVPDPPRVLTPTVCATGAFTDVREEREGPPGLWMSGWTRPCVPPAFSGWFRAIWYYGPVVVPSVHIGQYESATEPTAFSVRIAVPGGAAPTLGLTAVCLGDDHDRRLACLAIEAPTPGVLPVVAPIATDDPRVRYAVPVRRPGDEATWPVCGTCL